MTEIRKLNQGLPENNPQEVLRQKIASLPFPSSIEAVSLSELATNVDADRLPKTVSLLIGYRYLYIYRNDITDPQHTHAKVLVGRFEFDDNTNIINFFSDFDPNLVAETMGMLAEISFFSQLKNRFNIPDPNEESLIRARQIAEESNKQAETKQRKIEAIRQLARDRTLQELKRESIDIIDDVQVGSVGQGEVGYLSEVSRKRYLETLGAGPCIIVTAYNPEKKIASMSHIDRVTDEIATVNEMLREVGNTEIRVLGGDQSSINQLLAIKETLDQIEANVLEWDILNSKKSIVLDRETGRIYNVRKGRTRSDAPQPTVGDMFSKSMEGKKIAKMRIF